MTFIGLIAITGMTSCGNSTEDKIEDAEENVKDAKEDDAESEAELKAARIELASEYENYKLEQQAKLLENERKIAAVKVKLQKENSVNRAKYEKELEELNKRNELMRLRIQNFKQGARDSWESFKIGFSNEMEELGTLIKDFYTKDDVKK